MWDLRGGRVHGGELPPMPSGAVGCGDIGPTGGGMNRRPKLRDVVELGDREYRVVAEALRPVRGFWLGRDGGGAVCQRLVPLSAWSFEWNQQAKRWEGK